LGEGQVGQITLVCTTHTEIGRCNENELTRILESIRPDVIFEEMRRSDFVEHYTDSSKHTLEMKAMSRYLKNSSARQEPVDDYVIPVNFKRDMFALEEFVLSLSEEYRAALDEMQRMKFEYGFGYLNSQECVLQLEASERIFEETILKNGTDYAKSLLSMWNDHLRKRNEVMLENVYSFCRNNSFRIGVFLVGAGHLLPIVKGLEGRAKSRANLIEWKIWGTP
jgi:hypothetical protein